MNFEFQNPTKIVFGAGNISRLGEFAAQYGKHALIVTGGGSVKRNGTFDKAVASLKAAGVTYSECAGVEPNPLITTVARGADTIRKDKCDVVIALGGGSTMDASKVMAAAALYDGDPWNLIGHGQADWHIPTDALPIITVPTLAATGSETNSGAVISNAETQIKSFVDTPSLFPKVAIVDPELTISVPRDQTAYGVCDIIVHLTEGYLNTTAHAPAQDYFAEGVIKTAMEYGRRAVASGNDLEARSQVQWASILALIGWVQTGASPAGFPVHMIEHAISAHYNITHGAGLAIVNPAWMRFAAKKDPARFARFARNIMGLEQNSKDEQTLAMEGIDAYETFLKEIGCPTRLSELNINDEKFEQMAKESSLVAHNADGKLLAKYPMTVADIVSVLHSAL